MQISFLDKFKGKDNKVIHVYSSGQSFVEWQKKYLQQLDSQASFKLQIFYYTQSIKEIPQEQKQFLQSQHGQSIHTLKFQLNLMRLSYTDELNISFLLKSLTQLQKINFSSVYSQVQQGVANLIMESGLTHLQNIKILKFQNSFFSTSRFSQFLRNLKHLKELQLTIPDNTDIESNIITESQNLSHLTSYKVSFGLDRQFNIINPEQSSHVSNINKKDYSMVDIVMNQIIEMQDLNKLVLNISEKLQGEEYIKLLNSCLSHKKNLKSMSIDLSYHRMAYNIAYIVQLNPDLKTLKVNSSSSLNFFFQEIDLNKIWIKQIQEGDHNSFSNLSDNNSTKQIKNNCLNNDDDEKINPDENQYCLQAEKKYCLQNKKKFQFKQLEQLHLKLNFNKSSLVNSLFNFLNQQINLPQTLKSLHLEINFILNDICIQSIGHFLSKLQSLESLFFRCHQQEIENKDNIYLLRQIIKIQCLKELTFNMKVYEINQDYAELLQNFNQKLTKLDINLYVNIGFMQINKNTLIIYPISNEPMLYSVNEFKKQVNILNYLMNCFQNNKQLHKFYLLFSNIPNQSHQEVSQFFANFPTFELLEELSIDFRLFNILDIKYVLKELANIIPKLQKLKSLEVKNRNFHQTNFKEEYQKLLVTSISSNLYLKSINLENYSNQTYEDYQLLYLQNLLNVKSQYSKKLIPQIRAIQNKWQKILRKDIIFDLATQFLI